MEQRNLEKALELAAALIRGDRVSASGGNVALYEEYSSNSQVYDALRLILKKFGLELYEYNNALFVSADEDNAGMGDAGFGFTNEELRHALGVRVNKELFLCYLIIYCTMTESETAKMPVTISNSHPYPVKVKVSSLTDSMQIVTSRFDTVQVPPHGEAQVAFTIRVSTSGTANATISLFDRNGAAFGATQVTHITSALQISDKSGFVIIGFAVLLGAVGLWRQFNRKKDPDE